MSEQAQDALRRAEALLAGGDAKQALAWFDRAGRIAQDDATIALGRGQALVAMGDPRSRATFEWLAARHDERQIWLVLALLRTAAGEAGPAAAALAAALSGHRLPGEAAAQAGLPDGLASRIAIAAGAPGWCGLAEDDSLALWTPSGRVDVVCDGKTLRGRRLPPGVREIAVLSGGRPLLGSPLRAAAIRHCEGFVAAQDGGLTGWAWLPRDTGRDPVLRIVPVHGGPEHTLVASTLSPQAPRAMAHTRDFAVQAAALAGIAGPVRVLGPDGRDLIGSPLDPGLPARAAHAAATAIARALPAVGRAKRDAATPWLPLPAALPAHPAQAALQPDRPVAVVIPVYRGLALTEACLEAVFATAAPGTAVIAVDDASPEPAVAALLDRLAAAGRLHLIRHAENRGFPAAANAGLRAAAALAGAPDIVLLNSDTRPAPGWLATLRAAVHAAPDIGTAGPLSNDASILSYPDRMGGAAPPDGDLADLAALAARLHGISTVDIPTGVGFCLYVRRECLTATGLLREDAFAQGYGEENDFCLRASRLGWRHVAVPGAYVAHAGSASFGTAAGMLRGRNIHVVEQLHPGYNALIADFQARDPLGPARRALDAARFAARPWQPGGTVVIVTHDSGGGVERNLIARRQALAADGLDSVLLRPVVNRNGGTAARRYRPGLCHVDPGKDAAFPNLIYRLPDEQAALRDLLASARPRWVELHHQLGHHPSVAGLAAALGVPQDIHVHDYASYCPRITLTGAGGRYCGEPDLAACVACVDSLGAVLEEDIDPSALRRRSAAQFAAARAVIAPSQDAARRVARQFPGVAPQVREHEDDSTLPQPRPAPAGLPRRIGLIGGIGQIKGYDVLLGCARDAAARDLPLSFTVIGHTHDDERLLATGRVFITGPYDSNDAVATIAQHDLHLAWIPSIWPETWCYTLSEAIRAGLGVVTFDIGAQAERIRRLGHGWVLPLGLPTPAINAALLTVPLASGSHSARPAGSSATKGAQRIV